VGSLQDIFTGNYSTDVVCANGYSKMVPYETWNNQVRVSDATKSGPVTTIVVNISEIDQVLNKLGVVQRGRGSVTYSVSVDHSVPVNNPRRVPSVGPKIQQKKTKIGLQPKDLMVADLQEMHGEVNYQEIMEMYNFSSERYFKEMIKSLGYRLLRGELWVLEDKLWLKNQ